jgi:hypothetical protein
MMTLSRDDDAQRGYNYYDARRDGGGRSHLEWICARIGVVVDPIAERHRGWPAETIRPVLARAWRREFGGPLGEPGLSDTAAAIRDGRSWVRALWPDGR